jgi:hypothetical protein
MKKNTSVSQDVEVFFDAVELFDRQLYSQLLNYSLHQQTEEAVSTDP